MNLAVFGLLLQQFVIPAPRGYVSDFAGVLDPASITRMTAVIEDLKAKTGGEIAVVTLADLQGRAASDVALQIGRTWGVGSKGNPGDPARNRGIVILLVPRKNHRSGSGAFWIATGNGTEGFVTDAAAGRVRDAVLPQLAQEDYGSALVEATQLVAQRFADEFHVALDSASRPPVGTGSDSGTSRIPSIVPFLFIAFLVLSLALRGRRGGGVLPWLLLSSMSGRRGGGSGWGGWGGGGFGGGGGGGFGGFGGGGGFSGGGGGGSF
ncbi:MAG TPA: TPM domain-containing protein [Gemmatimonadales bacterium]|nr:TPM domain-containing protein [Gemmatimonadales bacterium]